MKITAIKAYLVWLGQLLVKVETNTEIYGWGGSWYATSIECCGWCTTALR